MRGGEESVLEWANLEKAGPASGVERQGSAWDVS